MKAGHPLLSISILISNRPETVEKCLQSLDTLRERVPSELILVDTGCGKEVRGIIEKYADCIVDFEWCNDFARARNAGLKLAKGQWFLFLDDDEWFEDTGEIQDFFLSGKYKKYKSGVYYVRNYLNLKGTAYTDDRVGRMCLLEEGVEFRHAVHESLLLKEPTMFFQCYVHHYGYAFPNEAARRAHTERNVKLLLEALEKEPEEIRNFYQLAQEYMVDKEYDKSMEICERGIQEMENSGKKDLRYVSSFYGNLVRCFYVKGEYGETVERGEEYLGKGVNDYAAMTIHAHLALAHRELENWEKAARAAEAYLAEWERLQKDPDVFALQEVSLLKYCLTERYCLEVTVAGIQAAIAMEDGERALEWFGTLEPGSKLLHGNRTMRNLVQDIVRAWIRETGEDGVYERMLRALMDEEEWLGAAGAYMDSLRKKEPEFLRGKKQGWDIFRDKGWQFSYLKLWANLSGEQISPEAAAKLRPDYVRFWCDTARVLPLSPKLRIWELGEHVGYAMEEVIGEIPWRRWKQGTDVAMAECGWRTLRKIHQRLTALRLDGDSLHFQYWETLYRLRELMESVPDEETRDALRKDVQEEETGNTLREDAQEKESGNALPRDEQGEEAGNTLQNDDHKAAENTLKKEAQETAENALQKNTQKNDPENALQKEAFDEKVISLLQDYAVSAEQLYRRFYRDELFTGSPELLPLECQAALKISGMLREAEAGQYQGATAVARELLELTPELSGALKCFSRWLRRKAETEEAGHGQLNPEMEELGREMKKRIRFLMEQGMNAEAKEALHQLKQFLPGDRELEMLERRCIVSEERLP
ncbi:MAG: glycosyltransferase [Blautia sp.]|nr:glycosyltransferase [Blautia sp.]